MPQRLDTTLQNQSVESAAFIRPQGSAQISAQSADIGSLNNFLENDNFYGSDMVEINLSDNEETNQSDMSRGVDC